MDKGAFFGEDYCVMISTWLMIVLGIEYAVIVIVALVEAAVAYHRGADVRVSLARALYFASAIGITVAVLWMGRR